MQQPGLFDRTKLSSIAARSIVSWCDEMAPVARWWLLRPRSMPRYKHELHPATPDCRGETRKSARR
eukprot:2019218-Lingulodinium_polyedra.AAC.1